MNGSAPALRKKPGAKPKPLEVYEAEAKWDLDGVCLIHPTHGVARRVYQLRHGQLLTKQYVCHHCDNPFCIRDDHHFLGSCGDNVRDAVAKGRHSCCKTGDKSHRHILTEAEARAILVSEHSNKVLADIFGVHHSTISKIRTRKNWSWL